MDTLTATDMFIPHARLKISCQVRHPNHNQLYRPLNYKPIVVIKLPVVHQKCLTTEKREPKVVPLILSYTKTRHV